MTGFESRPSDGRTGDTFFEQELVTALNNFANTSPVPHFDATGIQRRARRKRAGFITAVVAAVAVTGGGTALATVTAGGSHTSKPAAATSGNAAVLQFEKYKEDMGGMSLDFAKQLLLKYQLKLGKVNKVSTGTCKPGSIIGVDPHSPKSVTIGDTVNLTGCAG